MINNRLIHFQMIKILFSKQYPAACNSAEAVSNAAADSRSFTHQTWCMRKSDDSGH